MTFDDFAREHLFDWYDSGYCPNDWTYSTFLSFEAWVEENQSELSVTASWSDTATYWEGTL